MYETVLDGLYEVRLRVENGRTDYTCLCDELESATEGEWRGSDLAPAFSTFPGFTGSYIYPICTGEPCGYVFGWDLPERLALLDHCIRYFEEN